jgi:hypothetical protein
MKEESRFGVSESQIERELGLGWELISTKGTKSFLAKDKDLCTLQLCPCSFRNL